MNLDPFGRLISTLLCFLNKHLRCSVRRSSAPVVFSVSGVNCCISYSPLTFCLFIETFRFIPARDLCAQRLKRVVVEV